MLSLIAAVADNDVIGRDNKLPWRLSTDLKRFKELTLGHTVIMGRKTYESILEALGKPLPDRKNVIITRNKEYRAPGCDVINWDIALDRFEKSPEEVFVIGGGEMYKTALSFAEKIYLTRVHTNPEGDVLFPKLNPLEWRTLSSERFREDERNEYPTTFTVYERVN